jgi:mannose-1-phosphate guanylyltransferase
MTTHLHAIVLAAGEGSRVRSLTKNADGVCVPKQFFAVDGQRTMLGWTLDRATRLVPKERVVVVVAKEHDGWWRRDLADLPAENVVIQPFNRGTAVGLLLPFLKVLQRDPQARVVVLPSDHHVADEEALERTIHEALGAVHLDGKRVVLLGAVPQEPDTEYGWIAASGAVDGLREVTAFVEKPDRETARALMDGGAILNTLILVADGASLLGLFTAHLPGVLDALLRWRDDARVPERELEDLYRSLPAHDLSRDVLRLSCERLSVLPVLDSGWSDLGTPDRLRHFHRQHTAPMAS